MFFVTLHQFHVLQSFNFVVKLGCVPDRKCVALVLARPWQSLSQNTAPLKPAPAFSLAQLHYHFQGSRTFHTAQLSFSDSPWCRLLPT